VIGAGDPFLHGLASGDPLADRVVIWTRVTTTSGETADADWVMARDRDLGDVVASGTATAAAEHDHTVSVDVTGLEPDMTYFYGFESAGERSPVARTRTLPERTEHIRFAMVSCAKFNAGFFNAYARIAERDDLQFLLHLGDYIYEASNVPPPAQTPGADIGRPFDPLHECVTLDDYRRRYAQYRRDPDVQRLHAAHPIVATVDDHEFADGAWRDGADNHQPEWGPWHERKARAFQAKWEWVPGRLPDPSDPTRVFRTVPLGGLADLFLLDTRTRRDQPVPPPAMSDPDRSALGPEQREWLLRGLEASRAPWRLIGNSSVMGRTWNDNLPDAVRPHLVKVKLLEPEGRGPDFDQWDGYPAERETVLTFMREHHIRDVAVLSGDVHVSIALEMDEQGDEGQPLAVEFVTPSLTSQNLDDKMGWGLRTTSPMIERQIVDVLPHWKWCELDSHGYTIIDVTPERLRADWWFVDSVLERHDRERNGGAWMMKRGQARLVPAPPPA
jgi:alkaline phosphatase D